MGKNQGPLSRRWTIRILGSIFEDNAGLIRRIKDAFAHKTTYIIVEPPRPDGDVNVIFSLDQPYSTYRIQAKLDRSQLAFYVISIMPFLGPHKHALVARTSESCENAPPYKTFIVRHGQTLHDRMRFVKILLETVGKKNGLLSMAIDSQSTGEGEVVVQMTHNYSHAVFRSCLTTMSIDLAKVKRHDGDIEPLYSRPDLILIKYSETGLV